tara:strand:+ start:570 stop:752 length:183 start_codon:yes stop_codon:yes gene_type:complete
VQVLVELVVEETVDAEVQHQVLMQHQEQLILAVVEVVVLTEHPVVQMHKIEFLVQVVQVS